MRRQLPAQVAAGTKRARSAAETMQRKEEEEEAPYLACFSPNAPQQERFALMRLIDAYGDELRERAPDFFGLPECEPGRGWMRLERFLLVLNLHSRHLLKKLMCVRDINPGSHLLLCLGKEDNEEEDDDDADKENRDPLAAESHTTTTTVHQTKTRVMKPHWDGIVYVCALLTPSITPQLDGEEAVWHWVNHPDALFTVDETPVHFLDSIGVEDMPVNIPAAPLLPTPKLGHLHQFVLSSNAPSPHHQTIKQLPPPFRTKGADEGGKEYLELELLSVEEAK